MTPGERFDAAIALQHETAAELDACEDDARFVELVNAARQELFAAMRAMPESDEIYSQWGKAYDLIRSTELRAMARFRRRAVLATVELVRSECCDMIARGLAAEAQR